MNKLNMVKKITLIASLSLLTTSSLSAVWWDPFSFFLPSATVANNALRKTNPIYFKIAEENFEPFTPSKTKEYTALNPEGKKEFVWEGANSATDWKEIKLRFDNPQDHGGRYNPKRYAGVNKLIIDQKTGLPISLTDLTGKYQFVGHVPELGGTMVIKIKDKEGDKEVELPINMKGGESTVEIKLEDFSRYKVFIDTQKGFDDWMLDPADEIKTQAGYYLIAVKSIKQLSDGKEELAQNERKKKLDQVEQFKNVAADAVKSVQKEFDPNNTAIAETWVKLAQDKASEARKIADSISPKSSYEYEQADLAAKEAESSANAADREFQAAQARADLAQKIKKIEWYREQAQESAKCVNDNFATNKNYAGTCVTNAKEYLKNAKATAEAANLIFGKNDVVEQELQKIEQAAIAASEAYEKLEDAAIKKKLGLIENQKETADKARQDLVDLAVDIAIYDTAKAETFVKSATEALDRAKNLAGEIPDHKKAKEEANMMVGEIKATVADINKVFEKAEEDLKNKVQAVINQKALAQKALDECLLALVGPDSSAPDFSSYETTKAQKCVDKAEEAAKEAETLANEIPNNKDAKAAKDEAKAAADNAKTIITNAEAILTGKVTEVERRKAWAEDALEYINQQKRNITAYDRSLAEASLKNATLSAEQARGMANEIPKHAGARDLAAEVEERAKEAEDTLDIVNRVVIKNEKLVENQKNLANQALKAIKKLIGNDPSNPDFKSYKTSEAQTYVTNAKNVVQQAENLAARIPYSTSARKAADDAKAAAKETEQIYNKAEALLAPILTAIGQERLLAETGLKCVKGELKDPLIDADCLEEAKKNAESLKESVKSRCAMYKGDDNVFCINAGNNAVDGNIPSFTAQCIEDKINNNKLKCLKNTDSAAAEAQQLAATIPNSKTAKDEAELAVNAAREANKVFEWTRLNDLLKKAEDIVTLVYDNTTEESDIGFKYCPAIKDVFEQAQSIVEKILPDNEVQEILDKIKDAQYVCFIRVNQIIAEQICESIKSSLNNDDFELAKVFLIAANKAFLEASKAFNEIVSNFKVQAKDSFEKTKKTVEDCSKLVKDKENEMEQGIETCQKTVEGVFTNILSVNIQDLPLKDSLMNAAEMAFEEAKKLEKVISDQSYLALESMKETMALIYQNIAEASFECIKDTLAEKEAACIGWYCLEKVTYASTQAEALAKDLLGNAIAQEAAAKAIEKRDSCYDLLSKDEEHVECLKQDPNKDKGVMETIQKLYFKQETLKQKMTRLKKEVRE